MGQSYIHAHHPMSDGQQGRLHLCAETDVVMPGGIAREGPWSGRSTLGSCSASLSEPSFGRLTTPRAQAVPTP